MSEDIVSGLFGLSPQQVRQRQLSQYEDRANAAAMAVGQSPGQIMARSYSRIGSGLGDLGAGMLGLENPEIAQAKAREAAISGIDISNPDSILQRAQKIQDPQLKLRLTMLAQQIKSKQLADAKEAQAQALALRKQDFAENQAFELKKMEAEARIRQNDEKIKDARTTAEERAALMRDSNDIKRMLGLALIEQKRANAEAKGNKISNVDARSIDKSMQASSGANAAIQLLDQADALYSSYASGRDEPILGQAGRWGAAVGIGDKKRVSDYELADQIAKDLGIIKLGLIGGSDTELELKVAIDTAPSPDKLPSTNRAIISNQRRAIEILQSEPDFKTEWVNKNGSLSSLDRETGEPYGKAWRQYQKDNFRPVSVSGGAKKEQPSGTWTVETKDDVAKLLSSKQIDRNTAKLILMDMDRQGKL